ncbi:MAG: aminoglycoside/hydroxyurea antibiotic resistance kinase [Verrucomicrobia bacterium]|nr:aminoglycoside/hydroxyurea antibiotic resistance kinase [Verrucomicrobiota bacterium]
MTNSPDKNGKWLELVEAAKMRWDLREIQTVQHLSHNLVAFALQGKKSVVLKIGKISSEVAALECFHGEGAVLLLDKDETQGMMLLERLVPGVMLSTIQDDDEATHIAIDVMLKLRRPCPGSSNFIQLSEWFSAFKTLRTRYEGTTGPIDKKIFESAEEAVKGFFAEKHSPVLMHGDLHHYNILSSERGWVAIDPKGIVGPSDYEVGPFLLNPRHKTAEEIGRLTKRRIAILSERLGVEKRRIREWAIAHAVLSACWGLEDNMTYEYAMAFAAIIFRGERS